MYRQERLFFFFLPVSGHRQAEHGEEAAPRQETNAMLALRHSGRASAGVPGTLQRRPLVSLGRSASARVQFSERPEPGKLQRRSERPAARVSEAEVGCGQIWGPSATLCRLLMKGCQQGPAC